MHTMLKVNTSPFPSEFKELEPGALLVAWWKLPIFLFSGVLSPVLMPILPWFPELNGFEFHVDSVCLWLPVQDTYNVKWMLTFHHHINAKTSYTPWMKLVEFFLDFNRCLSALEILIAAKSYCIQKHGQIKSINQTPESKNCCKHGYGV